MKKLLVILSALALSVSVATAQQGPGPGDGSGTMEGPYGNNGGLWTYIEENLPEDSVELQDAYAAVLDLRIVLRDSRVTWLETHDSLEGWFESESDNITTLRDSVTLLRDWYREVRPDRPDPVMTGDMIQRRERFMINSKGITEAQTRLRLMLQNDPDNAECDQLREQLRLRLGERKQLLREQRRGEDSPGGEGDGNHRGG
jgi:hypothetical protein